MPDHISCFFKGELVDHYCGKNIFNELTALMAKIVHSNIISCAQSAKYFFIIAERTIDISHAERMFVAMRYVVTNENNDNEICERFLGFTSIDESVVRGSQLLH
jgi:hypothetical protein